MSRHVSSPTCATTLASVDARPLSSRQSTLMRRWKRYRPLFSTFAKTFAIFGVSLFFLIIFFKITLPPVDAEHSKDLKLPRSFEDLQRLNVVVQVYKSRNWFRVILSWFVLYLFLQAFSLPGSMYMSILAGAMYGLYALPLVCFAVATGASICYIMSAILGPRVLAIKPSWNAKIDVWREKIAEQGNHVISYMIILRIAPFPPHWACNIIAPHIGISLWVFWISTFLGVMGVSFIHVQIGTTLDEMTSPADFHLISWKNFFGLAGIVACVAIPIMLRRRYPQAVVAAEDFSVDAEEEEQLYSSYHSHAGLKPPPSTATGQLIFLLDNGEIDTTRTTLPKSLDSTGKVPDSGYGGSDSADHSYLADQSVEIDASELQQDHSEISRRVKDFLGLKTDGAIQLK